MSLRNRLVTRAVRLAAPLAPARRIPFIGARTEVEAWRRFMRRSALIPAPLGTRRLKVPGRGEWVLSKGADPSVRVLFLHGGAFVSGSPRSHLPIAAHLSRLLGAAVFSADYPLAPESTFPVTMEFLDSCRAWLWANGPEGPGEAERMFFAGDSAGGNLAAVQALRAIRADEALPVGVVLISPLTDCSSSGESWERLAATDAMLRPGVTGTTIDTYAPGRTAEELRHPDLSPLFAPDEELERFPPSLIFVGGQERLLDDSLRFVARLEGLGRDVELVFEEELFHDWVLFYPFVAAAARAHRRIAAFGRRLY